MNRAPARDERELAVDQAADRWAYLLVTYGLLIVVAWRAFADRESSWDLLGLVVLGGLVGAVHRVREHVASRTWAVPVVLATGLALVLAVLFVALGQR